MHIAGISFDLGSSSSGHSRFSFSRLGRPVNVQSNSKKGKENILEFLNSDVYLVATQYCVASYDAKALGTV
eukprot:93744-Amorphochlora_amoeboformis.AAC.1